MTSFKLFGAALVLSAIAVVPVSAQQAVQEPGIYSFYHPNSDVLSAGGPASSNAMAAQLPREAVAGTQMSVRIARRRPRSSVTELHLPITFLRATNLLGSAMPRPSPAFFARQ
jgi:hypothetical protein